MIGLVSSLVLKHVDLYYNPSLEFALMLCFVYIPYAFAEGIHLSGIMAILFSGIVMSQYTHYNLSPGIINYLFQSTVISNYVSKNDLFFSYTNYNATDYANAGVCLRILCIRLFRFGYIQFPS